MKLVLRADREQSLNAIWRAYCSAEITTSVVHALLNARYYDSARGQFVSEDPVFSGTNQNLKDPQSLNAYSYANNNPITGKDPDGKAATLAAGLVPFAEFAMGISLPAWVGPVAVAAGIGTTAFLAYQYLSPQRALDPNTYQASIGQEWNTDPKLPPRPPKTPWGKTIFIAGVTLYGIYGLSDYLQPLLAPDPDSGLQPLRPWWGNGNSGSYGLLTSPQSTSPWSLSQIIPPNLSIDLLDPRVGA